MRRFAQRSISEIQALRDPDNPVLAERSAMKREWTLHWREPTADRSLVVSDNELEDKWRTLEAVGWEDLAARLGWPVPVARVFYAELRKCYACGQDMRGQ